MPRLILGPHIIPYFSSFAEKKVFYFSTPFWEDYLNTLNIQAERNPILVLSEDDNLKAKNIFEDLMAKAQWPGQNWVAFLNVEKNFTETTENLISSIENYRPQKKRHFIFPPFVYLAIWSFNQYQDFLNSKKLAVIGKKQKALLAKLKGKNPLAKKELESLEREENYNWPVELNLAKKIWEYWLYLFLPSLKATDEILVFQKDFLAILKEGLLGGEIIENTPEKLILELDNKKICFIS